jgi:hypothetical protein
MLISDGLPPWLDWLANVILNSLASGQALGNGCGLDCGTPTHVCLHVSPCDIPEDVVPATRYNPEQLIHEIAGFRNLIAKLNTWQAWLNVFSWGGGIISGIADAVRGGSLIVTILAFVGITVTIPVWLDAILTGIGVGGILAGVSKLIGLEVAGLGNREANFENAKDENTNGETLYDVIFHDSPFYWNTTDTFFYPNQISCYQLYGPTC